MRPKGLHQGLAIYTRDGRLVWERQPWRHVTGSADGATFRHPGRRAPEKRPAEGCFVGPSDPVPKMWAPERMWPVDDEWTGSKGSFFPK